jgi:hypothetical protein
MFDYKIMDIINPYSLEIRKNHFKEYLDKYYTPSQFLSDEFTDFISSRLNNLKIEPTPINIKRILKRNNIHIKPEYCYNISRKLRDQEVHMLPVFYKSSILEKSNKIQNTY